MKIRNLILMILAAATALISCDNKDQSQPVPEYLDVNANNISGKWELVEWNGSALEAGTYVFLEIVRNDRSYKIYQNLDSFSDIPHVVTGSYNIETDPELGAIIRGVYDHDSGDWAHRYIIRDLTKNEMYWIAKDDPSFVQKYVRVESIPVE
ncbi:MAG: lipocalin family protein [Bacteroidales bacterium]|nr:lipocalin family protein [Bacteroidales bacterium]